MMVFATYLGQFIPHHSSSSSDQSQAFV